MFQKTLRRLQQQASQNPPVGSANIPSPYATEGGHVPIWSIVNGFVQKRNWVFRNPEWCDLCKEPVALWVNHHGRKDHALMDMHYTQMMEYPRRWNPEEVLVAFFDELQLPVETYQRSYTCYERAHRNELYSMLVELEEAKMLYFGEPRNTYLHRMQGGLRGMDHQGALVLHRYILGPFMRLYPNAHIQDFSNLVDFVTCAYNMETVYDLCGFYTLDKVALKADYKPSSPAALGLGGIAVHSSPSHGFVQNAAESQQQSRRASSTASTGSRSAADMDEEAFSRKAVFVRQLLGQLRWLTLPCEEHPAGCKFPQHLMLLGEICLKYLVVEIIAARLCEYMVRVESVWRDHGYERVKLNVDKIMKQGRDILPEPIKYFYRPMSPNMDDLYSTKVGVLDEALEKAAVTQSLSKGV
ncbi:KREPB7 [Trypanosoma brucei gambiense DAL972]|uniref:RNA-editing complex protein n=1 Tax=Trypanosoma brucei gambiense (strain MHOM/CI/86/DAL972) TaxID=679716 RepID=C9ZXS8_TRYB9|nr:KREPB7 [Trypanosoma brucei gambiense DAL972]CBH14223.1 KREPB7 [Trypanosoma brucei gambiense DAL972]|eukprot:XP_011776493.1 KREPB7 [Trypanosoma brucei gambiense DAL972]